MIARQRLKFQAFEKAYQEYLNVLGETHEQMTQEDLDLLYEGMVQEFPDDTALLKWWIEFEKGYKNASPFKTRW